MIQPLAHLALFAAVYVAAAVVCAAQLTGTQGALTPVVLLYAWSTALLAYLLDRVKLRDAWLDPADRQAHPDRFAFLFTHRRAARLLMAGAGVVSLVSGWMIHPTHPIAAAGTFATIAGVLLYAGRPRTAGGGARVKDRFVVKNLFVGAGIAGFAVLIVCIAAARRDGVGTGGYDAASISDVFSRLPRPPLLLALAFAYLTLCIYADAVLCDIDDEDSDRAHGTRTLPARFGGARAWDIAMWLRLALAASLLLWPVGPFAGRAAWAIASAAGTIALRWWRPAKIRDLVDARFGVEAACVWAVLTLPA